MPLRLSKGTHFAPRLNLELQLDAVVAVGGDGLAGHAQNDGRLRAVHGGLGMQPQAVFVVTQRAVRRAAASTTARSRCSGAASFAVFFLQSMACVR